MGNNSRIRFHGECVPSYQIPGAYLSATMFDRGFPGFPGNHDLRDMLVSQAVWSVSGRNRRLYLGKYTVSEKFPERFEIKIPSVPGKARRILRGESPRRVRVGHPHVSSLASMAELSKDGEQYGLSVDRESCRP